MWKWDGRPGQGSWWTSARRDCDFTVNDEMMSCGTCIFQFSKGYLLVHSYYTFAASRRRNSYLPPPELPHVGLVCALG